AHAAASLPRYHPLSPPPPPLPLHDALPISSPAQLEGVRKIRQSADASFAKARAQLANVSDSEEIMRSLEQASSKLSEILSKVDRSEEHTSELQSHLNLVCRLLLEKKKTTNH